MTMNDQRPAESHRPAPPRAATGLDARSALQALKDGYQRHLAGHSQVSADRVYEQIKANAQGQKPFAIVLACADSRVPPEIVFDQDVGDLFVVRVAGNVADTFTLGSIQYAIEHLGTRLVVVLGHERCGAISAALSVAAKQASFAGPLGQLVSAIVPLVEPVHRRGVHAGLADAAAVLDEAVRVNVKRQAAVIRDALENLDQETLTLALWLKQILVVGARYDLDDGTVEFFNEPGDGRPKRIGLVTAWGLGLAVEADGSLTAVAGRDFDTFEMREAGPGRLALKSLRGPFLSAVGDSGVAATGTAIGDAERLRFLDLGDKRFAFQDVRGRYLSAGADGRVTTAAEAHDSEHFRIVEVDE